MEYYLQVENEDPSVFPPSLKGHRSVNIPKDFIRSICVADGQYKGYLASPCLCGDHTDPEDPSVALVGWYKTGQLMYVHRECVSEDA